MTSLAEKIKFIYPDIDFLSNVKLRDDGAGAYIAEWNDSRPQPSQADIDAAELPAAKQKKTLELKSACKAVIEGGFVSSALGTPHTYDSGMPHDQSNLIGAKLASVDMNFTCTDQNGLKWERWHTSIQIGQVYADGMAHIQSAKSNLYAKLSLVTSATTVADVMGISW